jgi:hypothetical protein
MTASDYERACAPLSALHFSFAEPTNFGALLRQLGAPAAWSGAMSPADVFEPAIRAAAEKARQMAMAEVVETNECVVDAMSAETADKGKRRRKVWDLD